MPPDGGGYSCTCCWEIAEGNFSPTEEPGCLRVTWTGWAELRHRSDEPFDPGTIAANWEPKELDADRHRLPSTLVPTEKGMLNLQSLCLAWADEDAGSGAGDARRTCVRTKALLRVPKLDVEVLSSFAMRPDHLVFWAGES